MYAARVCTLCTYTPVLERAVDQRSLVPVRIACAQADREAGALCVLCTGHHAPPQVDRRALVRCAHAHKHYALMRNLAGLTKVRITI